MNPTKKKVKKLEHKFNAKQKALKKQEERKNKGLGPKKSLAEKRKEKKKVKIKIMAKQSKLARKHKFPPKDRTPKLDIPKLLTIADLWKEMMESAWTMSLGLLEDELRRRNNKIIVDHVNKKKTKPYVPSTRALAHHQYVQKSMEENERKKKQHLNEQQKKKQVRKQKNQLSLNRLVCIQKDKKMIRLRAITAQQLVKDEGWKFIAKKYWKKARAGNEFELYWDLGHVNLNKVNEPNYGELAVKQKKAELKDKQIKEKVNITATKNRKKRKNPKRWKQKQTLSNFYTFYLNNPIRVMEINNQHFIIDEENNKYYRFSSDKLKELTNKFGSTKDIVEAIEAKDKSVEGFYSFGELDSQYFLDLVCGNIGFEDEPKVTGIAKRDTQHNTFLLDGNTEKFYIFTKKHYLALLKEHKSPNGVIKFVEGLGDKCVKVTKGKFTDEFFKEKQWPVLKSKKPNFIKDKDGSKNIQEQEEPVRKVAQNAQRSA